MICHSRYVGKFMSRGERLEQMGDKARNFTNVYIKNFGDELNDDKLRELFEPFGKIISARVSNISFYLIKDLNYVFVL